MQNWSSIYPLETAKGYFTVLNRYRLFCLSFLIVCLLSACSGHFAGFNQKRLTFTAAGNELYATLITPRKGAGPFPTLIFVHGDGDLKYDAYGYYRPIWEALASRGIASFSWDKPGTGGSSGNWELQSMKDRAQEVTAAINFLKKSGEPVVGESIGVIGFSQAGWVLPLLPEEPIQPKYMVFVSTAVNWLEQGEYYTRKRLEREEASEAEIKSTIEKEAIGNELLQPNVTYEEYVTAFKARKKKALFSTEGPMSEDRYKFVKQNWRSDASQQLKNINVPVLALFGEEDLNVNVNDSVATYRREFERAGHNDFTIKIFPNATHNLTKANYRNTQLPGLPDAILINVLGDNIFSEGVLDYLADWVLEKSK